MIRFRNLNNESFGIIFYTASFAWPSFALSLIKPRDIIKEFQQKAKKSNARNHYTAFLSKQTQMIHH